MYLMHHTTLRFIPVAVPLENYPQEIKDAVSTKPLISIIQATGTEPPSYHFGELHLSPALVYYSYVYCNKSLVYLQGGSTSW